MNNQRDGCPDIDPDEVEICVWELKLHGLVKDGKEPHTFAITERAIQLIETALTEMSEMYPEASEADVLLRALIVVVLHELGGAVRDYLPHYTSILSGLIES
jgi:hypothetical protein